MPYIETITSNGEMALSDTKSFYLLSKIASADADSQSLLSETELSAKAFYSRMSCLLKIGIITRKGGKYSLTSFCKIVYHAQDLISTALNNYWRPRPLDSLGMSLLMHFQEESIIKYPTHFWMIV